MRKFAVSAGLAISLSVIGASSAFAFGDGCGHAVACYDKVPLPDVYATRARPVLVSPGWREFHATPPIIANTFVPVLVRPGRWRTALRPPIYGTRLARVMVAPPSRVYEVIPPVTRQVAQTVVVSRGGVHWERSHGLFGGERICKVASGPVTRTVVRDVVVSPGRRIAHVIPAVYARVAQPIMVRPPTAAHFYEPPVRAMLSRAVVVQPSYLYTVDHPPVVGIAHEQVLVRSGGYAWQRSRPGIFGGW